MRKIVMALVLTGVCGSAMAQTPQPPAPARRHHQPTAAERARSNQILWETLAIQDYNNRLDRYNEATHQSRICLSAFRLGRIHT